MLGVAALVLSAVVALSYRQWEQFRRANVQAAQTRDVIDSIDQLLSSVTDAETGQRGYLLTGEDRYLEPYNQALQVIPDQLGMVKRLLAGSASESGNLARLSNLVDQKLAELRRTIDLRRMQGLAPAMTVVLSDQGERAMHEIRALVAQIRRSELSSQAQASTEGEAAAGTALLAAVAGSLMLLFLLAFGLEPLASPDPQAQRRSWPLRYGVAVLTVVVIVLFRAALTPLMGDRSMPFTLFFPAVWFAAWFGGLRPGVLAVVLSVLAGSYFFAEPTRSLLIRQHDDQIAMLMLVIVGFGMALLSRSQQGAVERAMQAENAERVERRKFETTLASIGDAVIVTDAIGNVTFSNKVASSLTGWREDAASGKHLDEVFRIVNELTRAKVESPVARVLREGILVGLANHTVLIARDGREIPIDDSGAPVLGENGLIQGTVLVFRDVSVQRRAEAATGLVASIVESSDDAIVSKDLNGMVTSWNRGAEKIFGYSAEEMIGRPIALLAPDDRKDEMPLILERIKRGERIDNFQTVRRAKNGELIHVSLTISPLHDALGRVTGASKIARDISESKRMEQERLDAQVRAQALASEKALREMEAELARVVRALSVGELAASIAHEVNQPLAGVVANAEAGLRWLSGETPNLHEVKESLALIVRDGNRASAIIRRIREFLKKQRVEMISLDMNETIQEAVALAQPELLKRRVTLRIDGSEALPAVRGDRVQLQQVILNLILNGSEAMASTNGSKELQLTSRQSADGGVLIAVRDSGVGVKPEDLSRLFDPFFTTKEMGMGLGLSISRSIIESHRGRIWAESNLGPGLTVQFSVPPESPGSQH